MGSGMYDVTDSAVPVVDIWPYVELLVDNGRVLTYVFHEGLVEKVYRNREGLFEHVLLPTDNANCYIVLVVDLSSKAINGHYRLDLNNEYGI